MLMQSFQPNISDVIEMNVVSFIYNFNIANIDR